MSKNYIENTPPGAAKPEVVYQGDYVPVMLQNMGNDDEVSLIDLWLVLARRKWIIVLVMLLSVLLALFYAMSKPDVYRYFASIEIGVMVHGDERGFLEQPESVLAKLKKSYVPEVLSQYDTEDTAYEIEASLDKGTHIITVQAEGAEDEAALYQQMITEIIRKIHQDHRRISGLHKKEIDLAKSRTQNQLTELKDKAVLLLSQEKITKSRVQNQLTSLKDAAALLQSQEKRIDEKEQLLKQRITDIKRSLENAEATRQLAAKNVTTEGKALALLMMDNDIRSRADRLAGLEEELAISINNEREVIANRLLENRRKQTEVLEQLDKLEIQQANLIMENRRKQTEAVEQLDKLEIQQANLLETRALSSPMQSLKPVGKSKKLILAVALFAGLFLGIFAAFFAEFLSRVREYQMNPSAKSTN